MGLAAEYKASADVFAATRLGMNHLAQLVLVLQWVDLAQPSVVLVSRERAPVVPTGRRLAPRPVELQAVVAQ